MPALAPCSTTTFLRPHAIPVQLNLFHFTVNTRRHLHTFSNPSSRISIMALQPSEVKELHKSIIDYLTNWSRIMSAHDINTWTEFVDFSDCKYLDYSREDLRDEFYQAILPKILTYDLTPMQKRKIEIFANHSKFERTDIGFVEIESKIPPPVEGVDFVTLKNADKFPEIACVLIPLEKSFEGCPPDLEVLTWISAIHSTDEELMNFTLLHPKEIQERIQKASEEFKRTGELPPNLNEDLAEKIERFTTAAKEMIAKLDVIEE